MLLAKVSRILLKVYLFSPTATSVFIYLSLPFFFIKILVILAIFITTSLAVEENILFLLIFCSFPCCFSMLFLLLLLKVLASNVCLFFASIVIDFCWQSFVTAFNLGYKWSNIKNSYKLLCYFSAYIISLYRADILKHLENYECVPKKTQTDRKILSSSSPVFYF